MLYFSKTNNMNTFRNLIEEENQNESADLLTVPGAATMKACSIAINAFLQHPVFPETIRRSKSITNELVNDIASLSKSISVTEPIQFDNQASTADSEILSEIPVASKAQG